MKTETIEEFIARGGRPEIVPYQEPKNVKDLAFSGRVSSSIPPSSNFISFGEADLFSTEQNKNTKPKKKKPELKIDISLLPESLRKKYCQELTNEDE